MFCQLISNMTWQSSSIKVLQKKKFVGSFEWNSCQQGSGLERSLQCTMCKSANVLMCKSSRDGSELKRTLQIVQKCKCVNVQIKSRWIRAQKNFANCATQHRSRGLNSLLANFLGSSSKRKSRFEVGSLVGGSLSYTKECLVGQMFSNALACWWNRGAANVMRPQQLRLSSWPRFTSKWN